MNVISITFYKHEITKILNKARIFPMSIFFIQWEHLFWKIFYSFLEKRFYIVSFVRILTTRQRDMLELVIWFLFVEFFGWRRLQNEKKKETKNGNKETFPPKKRKKKKIISSNPHTWQLRQKPIPISNIFRTELIFQKNYNYAVKIKN